MTDGSLMKVKSFLQYFQPALSNNQSWKPILVFFMSGHLRQDLLYVRFNWNELKPTFWSITFQINSNRIYYEVLAFYI